METVVVSTRIPKELARDITVAAKGAFLNEADFIRAAIRRAVLEQRIDAVSKRFEKHGDSVKAVRELRTITNEMTRNELDDWVKENSKDMPR